MTKQLAWIAALCIATPLLADTYNNPVIGGFHPDPSICRVGDTYYLVNSSFQYFPGVPLYESKDLIHWQQTGNVLSRDSQVPLNGSGSRTGVYAPTIRYNDGTFYMVTTNTWHGGNFFVTSTNPREGWSEPIWLEQQGIDPSFYFEDGKCYMCSNPDGTIYLCEIDVTNGKQLTESRQIWGGTGGRYPEGPHLYKKDGYYYLLISEGGTELAHGLTIARSRNIYGPYESNPANPIMTNCNHAGETKQVQGTGHGDFVQAPDGSWWMVFLAYRNFGGSYHHLGRETYLAPVRWEEGEWPVINEGLPIDTVMNANLLPQQEMPKVESSLPGVNWVYIQNPIKENYSFDKKKWTLRPHGTLTQNEFPTYIGTRQESPNMTFETTVEVNPKKCPDTYGISVYQIADGHMDFCLQGDKLSVVCQIKNLNATANSVSGMAGKKVTLRVTSDGNNYHFLYSTDGGKNFTELAALSCTLLSTEVVDGFTGVTIGLFAEGFTGLAQFTTPVYSE